MEKWGARIMSTQVFANIMTRAVYYARKKTSWYGRQLDKDLLLLFDECCMNLCSVCVVWIFGSKEGASGLTLDQASVMCCRPSPCNVEYYTSMDNIQYTWTGYREYIYSIDQELVWNSEFSTQGAWATNPPSLASFWLRSYFEKSSPQNGETLQIVKRHPLVVLFCIIWWSDNWQKLIRQSLVLYLEHQSFTDKCFPFKFCNLSWALVGKKNEFQERKTWDKNNILNEPEITRARPNCGSKPWIEH